MNAPTTPREMIAHLQHELSVANNWIEHHQNHVDDLIKENAALREKFTFAESEIILLRVERDELREALKPFREYAIQHGPMNLHGRNSALITVKHWQRAIYPSGRRSRE